MEIRALRLVVTEADLNELTRKFFAWPEAVRNPHITIVPEGLLVTGTYQTLIGIPFQLMWRVWVREGRINGQLERLKAGPISLGLLKRFFVDAIAGATSSVEVRDETLVLDIDRLLQEEGWSLRTNLASITCADGRLTIESNASAVGGHGPESVS
jgi:hypothetical protein